MRTEAEMIDLIINTAKNDGRVRAVQMQGSRTNPGVPADCFQDFDICYYVNDIGSFIENPGWVDVFGERFMLQFLEVGGNTYLYSMLFTDGNRIDLVLLPRETWENGVGGRSYGDEAVWLYTKDDIFKPFHPATHEAYNIKPPEESGYGSTCNKFWWYTQYVAKGIFRDELPYVMFYLNTMMRDELNQMIEWYIGQKNNFSVSSGKYGKYYKRYLDARQYDMLCKTYVGSGYADVWEALFTMCGLFRETALYVARHNNFEYPMKDDENMLHYLRHTSHVQNGLNNRP